MLEETDADLAATLSVALVWQFIRRHQRTSTKYCILLLADLQMSTRSLAKAFIHRLRTHHATHEEGRRVTTTATVALLQSQLDNNA